MMPVIAPRKTVLNPASAAKAPRLTASAFRAAARAGPLRARATNMSARKPKKIVLESSKALRFELDSRPVESAELLFQPLRLCAFSASRSAPRRILPLAVLGRSSTNSTACGTLWGAATRLTCS